MRCGRTAAALAALILSTLAAGCNYGPSRDQSRFEGARLLDDNATILLSAHQFLYRPATGIAAFPDGGIPRYVRDRHILALYHVPTGKVTVLDARKNTEFAPGQGTFHILDAAGDWALVVRAGQSRRGYESGDYDLLRLHYLVHIPTGDLRPIDVAGELARRGRAPGSLAAITTRGDLLFETPSLEEAERHLHWRREREVVPEFWLRERDGGWSLLAATRHLEHFDETLAVWWDPGDRKYRILDRATGELRIAERWRQGPPERPVVSGAGLEDQGRRLTLGRKDQGSWVYEPLPLTLEELFARR